MFNKREHNKIPYVHLLVVIVFNEINSNDDASAQHLTETTQIYFLYYHEQEHLRPPVLFIYIYLCSRYL